MTAEHPPRLDADRLRRVVLVVALINFVYFFVEFTVALLAGSVSCSRTASTSSRTRRSTC